MLLKIYAVALPVFFLIDFIWLALVARKFYLDQIGFLMKTNINWPVAILFYLLFIIGLVIFAIAPALEKKSLYSTILMGGLFGFFTYATYDLTNLATLKNWPVTISIADIAWRTILAATVSAITFVIVEKIG